MIRRAALLVWPVLAALASATPDARADALPAACGATGMPFSPATDVAASGQPGRDAEVLPASGLHRANGKRLYVAASGHGPPVVFLHGGGSRFEQSFAAQIGAFAASHTVIGIDQRGQGHSPDTDAPFSYPEMAEDTACLLQSLQAGPVDLVGLSDGANVALLVASHHPALVRHVVVSGANVRGDFLGMLEYAWRQLEPMSRFSARFTREQREDYARASPDGTGHWPVMLGKLRALWNTWRVVSPAELKAISAPVLVLEGEHDFIPLAHGRAIAQAVPHGQFQVLSAAGHRVMSDQPDAYNRAVEAFLATPLPR